MKAAISWYRNNEMVANLEKFQLMLIVLNDDITLCIDINGSVVLVMMMMVVVMVVDDDGDGC